MGKKLKEMGRLSRKSREELEEYATQFLVEREIEMMDTNELKEAIIYHYILTRRHMTMIAPDYFGSAYYEQAATALFEWKIGQITRDELEDWVTRHTTQTVDVLEDFEAKVDATLLYTI